MSMNVIIIRIKTRRKSAEGTISLYVMGHTLLGDVGMSLSDDTTFSRLQEAFTKKKKKTM